MSNFSPSNKVITHYYISQTVKSNTSVDSFFFLSTLTFLFFYLSLFLSLSKLLSGYFPRCLQFLYFFPLPSPPSDRSLGLRWLIFCQPVRLCFLLVPLVGPIPPLCLSVHLPPFISLYVCPPSSSSASSIFIQLFVRLHREWLSLSKLQSNFTPPHPLYQIMSTIIRQSGFAERQWQQWLVKLAWA